MKNSTLLLILALGATAGGAEGGGRDGRRFDPGAVRTAPATGAPEQLSAVGELVGSWEVARTTWAADGTETVADCTAVVSYFNRGHGLMERLRCPGDSDSLAFDAAALLVYDAGTGRWVRGEADSWTEAIHLASGDRHGERLVLLDAIRRNGGSRLVHLRRTLTPTTDGFEWRYEESTDDRSTWQPRSKRTLRRPTPDSPPPATASDFGAPDRSLPDAARAFDFLIGDWTARHTLTLPGGQQIQWSSNSSAVYLLGGRAILEFDWFDADPQLPDAATTILRIYNRAMRRWESLYSSNRAGSLLHFGGRAEGDRIVLHSFAIDTAAPSISHYVFHDIAGDSYRWFAESSTDRGATFTTNWAIEAVRNPEPAGE